MTAFEELDWTRFDVWAVVAEEGVAVVEAAQRSACLAWLREQGYAVESIDFGQGVGPAVIAIGQLFHWQEQFGYALTPESRNLDALRDGFDFTIEAGAGCVLELLNAQAAHREDPQWFRGLLAIASEHSRWQLALGRRFFVTLFLDRGSSLVGMPYETRSIPVPFWTPGANKNPFS